MILNSFSCQDDLQSIIIICMVSHGLNNNLIINHQQEWEEKYQDMKICEVYN